MGISISPHGRVLDWRLLQSSVAADTCRASCGRRCSLPLAIRMPQVCRCPRIARTSWRKAILKVDVSSRRHPSTALFHRGQIRFSGRVQDQRRDRGVQRTRKFDIRVHALWKHVDRARRGRQGRPRRLGELSVSQDRDHVSFNSSIRMDTPTMTHATVSV